jgi:hypothetical protein
MGKRLFKALKLASFPLIIFLLFILPFNASANDWRPGNIVGLCKGTEIRVGSGFGYRVHTIVPEDNWAVKIIGGPRYADGEEWWDTSRREAGDPSGGTGWVYYRQATSCQQQPPPTATPQPSSPANIRLVSDLSLSKSNPAVGEWVNATFRVKNYGEQTFTARFFGVKGRGPGDTDYSFHWLENFSLAPGEEYTYDTNRSFDKPGNYWFTPNYSPDGNSWADIKWSDDRVSYVYITVWKQATPVPPTATPVPSQPANVRLLSGLSLSNNNPVIGEWVNATFKVRNYGDQTFHARYFGVKGRGPNDSDYSFFWIENFSLEPGQEYAYSTNRSFDKEGNYWFTPNYSPDGSNWVDIKWPDGSVSYVNVTVRSAAVPTPIPPTPTPASLPLPLINFWVDKDNIVVGECTTLRWDVEHVRAVYLEGAGVVGHDSRSVCPNQTTTYSLRVVTDSGDIYRTVTVNVSQAASSPALATPTPKPTPTPEKSPTYVPTPSEKLAIGDIVEVSGTGSSLRLRSGPGLSHSVKAKMSDGTRLKIIGGPVNADGYVWWEVEGAGLKGWVAGNWLTSISPLSKIITTQIPLASDWKVEYYGILTPKGCQRCWRVGPIIVPNSLTVLDSCCDHGYLLTRPDYLKDEDIELRVESDTLSPDYINKINERGVETWTSLPEHCPDCRRIEKNQYVVIVPTWLGDIWKIRGYTPTSSDLRLKLKK